MKKSILGVLKWIILLMLAIVMLVLNITVRQSRQSGVARATCPD